jgi:hypothetical protein
MHIFQAGEFPYSRDMAGALMQELLPDPKRKEVKASLLSDFSGSSVQKTDQ